MPRLPLEGIRVIDMYRRLGRAVRLGAAGRPRRGGHPRRDGAALGHQQPHPRQRRTAMRQARGGRPADDAEPWNTQPELQQRRPQQAQRDHRPQAPGGPGGLLSPRGRCATSSSRTTRRTWSKKLYADLRRTLKQHNPKLIMCSMPAFGSDGPYSHFRALRRQHGGRRRPHAAAWLHGHRPHAQHQRLPRRRLRRRHRAPSR